MSIFDDDARSTSRGCGVHVRADGIARRYVCAARRKIDHRAIQLDIVISRHVGRGRDGFHGRYLRWQYDGIRVRNGATSKRRSFYRTNSILKLLQFLVEWRGGSHRALPETDVNRLSSSGSQRPTVQHAEAASARRALGFRASHSRASFGTSWQTDRSSGSRRSVRRWTRTKCILIASSNGRSPCCCGSRTCGRGRSKADPFGKNRGILGFSDPPM